MAPLSDEAKARKKEYNKKWATANKERMKELQAEFLERNPNYMRDAQRKYFKANREKVNQRAVQRRLENLEEKKQKERDYYHKRKAILGPEEMKKKTRDYKLRGQYGVTLEQFNEMFEAQGSKCASCKTISPGSKYQAWHLDHCHTTGKVRGILCHHCNVIVGMSKEDTNTLEDIINYLNQHKDHIQ